MTSVLFFNDTATTEIYTLSLHDALPICQWYAHQRHDLDLEFMQSIDDALSRVVARPQQYPTVYRTLRRCVVRRFRSEEHTSELQSHSDLVCRLLLEKKKTEREDCQGALA